MPWIRRARRIALTGLAVTAAVAAPAAGAGPDSTPPVVVVSGATGAWTNAGTTTASASASDPGSGVASVEYRTSTDDGTTWTSPAVGTTVDVTAEGTTLVQFRATDNSSNVSAWTSATAGAGGSIRVDRTGPTAPGAAPDQMPGVIAWFDASDGSTVTLSGGGVTRWADRSGNSNDATQTTPGNRPTSVAAAQNGHAVVRFATGGAQWLALPSLTPRAILVAGRKQALGNYNVIIGASGASDSYLAFGTSGGLGNAIAQNGSGAALSPAASETSWQVLGGVDDGSTITAYRNGGAGTPASTGGATWNVDGIAVNPTTGFRLAGDLGEVVVFDRVPPTADRQLMEGYLAWKWGTQASLAGGHPYASASPGAYGGSSSWSLSGPRSVTVSGGSDGLSGVASYDYRTSTDGGITWGAPQAGSSVSVNTDGETLVQFRAMDNAGNVSAWAPSAGTGAATIRIDRVAPSVTVSGATGAWSNAASVTVTGPATDASSGVATTQYRTAFNGGGYTAANTGSSVTVSAEGETLVQFRATDVAGNVSAWSTATSGGAGSVRIDRNGPATAPALTGAAGAWSSAASATVTASGSSDAGSGIGGYESRLSTDNGGTWSSPAAGASVTISGEGTTLVQFRALDNSGNSGPWSTATAGGYGSVRLDRTGPAAPSTSGGSTSWVNAASRTITATGGADAGSGTTGYQWASSTDNGATWGASQSGSSTAVSPEGQTLVRFRAVDALGNTSAWSSAETVRLDRTNPTVSASGATGAWTSVATVTVSSTSSDAVSSVATTDHRTSTDGGASWATPVAGTSVAVTAEAETLVQFRATDAAGNSSAWTAATPGGSGSVRIDRTAPGVTQSGADGVWSASPSRTVIASPTDAASGVAGAQYRTSDDRGSTWSATAAGASTTVTREGVTLVQFRATDNAGNTSGWTTATAGAAGSVQLDRTSPAVSVSGATGAWSNAASLTATATATDSDAGLAGYQSRTSADGGASWDAPQSAATVAVTGEGVTLVQFRATDNAGNTSPWSAASAGGAGSIRIDRTAPVVSVSGDGTWTNSASVTVSASAADPASGVSSHESRTSLDGGATWSAPVGGAAVTVTAEGETLAQFRATDGAGNVSGWTAAAPGGAGSVRLDRAPPGSPLMIITPDAGVAVNSSRGAVTILTAPAQGDTRSVRVVVTQNGRLVHDGGFGTVRDEGLADSSQYTYQAVAYDRLGNVSPVNESVIATPDRTPPAQPVAPDATGWPPRVTWTAASGSTVYRVLRDGVEVGTSGGPAFTDPGARDIAPPVSPGGVASEATATGVLLRWMPVADRGTLYRYQVIAADAEGNSTASPQVQLESTSGGVSFQIAVDGSPVAAASGRIADQSVTTEAVVTSQVPLPAGMHDLTVTAIDAAGNRSEPARLTARGPDPGPTTLTARASTAFARPGEDITFTAGAPTGAKLRWTFPDGRTLTGGQVTRSFRAGTVTAQVVARMPDGLELTTQVTVIVDGTVPTLDAKMLGRSLRVVPQDATGLASLSASIDGRAAHRMKGFTLAIPEGRHRVTLIAVDAAGNTRRMTVTAVVDTRGPTVVARASTRPGAATGRINWSVRDGASGPGGARVNEGRSLGAHGTADVPAGMVAVLVGSDRYGNITRLTAPVPAPIRLAGLKDPGLQGRKGDRLLPGGAAAVGMRAVVLTEARARMVWAGVLRAGAGSGRYDAAVTKAVARFQTLRHVREPAGRGVLGPATLKAMDLLARWGGWGASAGRG